MVSGARCTPKEEPDLRCVWHPRQARGAPCATVPSLPESRTRPRKPPDLVRDRWQLPYHARSLEELEELQPERKKRCGGFITENKSQTVRLEVPIPPSTNQLFRASGRRGKFYKARCYMGWLAEFAILIPRGKALEGLAEILIEIHGGEGWTHRRDLYKTNKAVIDMLENKGFDPVLLDIYYMFHNNCNYH